MKKYQNRIGDGKLPNIYYVFHYDEKAILQKDNTIKFPDKKVDGGYLGQFKSYKKALACVDKKAFYPHIIIEDRLSGVIFETLCKICECCDEEKYITHENIEFTKEKLGTDFI